MSQATDLEMPAPARLSLPEFTAMLATLFATLAFSIDAMLPALPAIAAELTPNDINRAQLVLTAFVLGMGLGTLMVGPISDAIGRKPAISAGVLLYVIGAVMAHLASSIEMLLAARVIQGLGASGPRIVGLALARDIYAGREMARVMSFVMMVFMIVPAMAPAVGAGIIAFTGWRGLFLAFITFGLVAISWVTIRQPETLPVAKRRPLSIESLRSGMKEVWANRDVRIYTLVMALGYGQMFALLSSIQPIFDVSFGRAAGFPLWFALIAVTSASASFINSRLVMRLGMRKLATLAYLGEAILSAVILVVFGSDLLGGWLPFACFMIWANSVFFIAGLTFGNLNALALQEMGHIAGLANSIITAIATMGAVLIAGPVGLAFDGSPVPCMIGALVCSAICFVMMRRTLPS